MNLAAFTQWALAARSVGKHQGGYVGQCVSLINQYCWQVLGVPADAWGDAKDWPYNSNVLNYFDRVASPQAGDIGVMGSNYGGGYGHIFIYETPGTILEQNGARAGLVTTGPAYGSPMAILRRKGVSTMASQAEINRVGTMAINDNWEGQIHTLQRQFADAQKGSRATNPANGEVRDAPGWFAAYDERNTQMVEALKTIAELRQKVNLPVIDDDAVLAYLNKRLKG